jgi:hypothetical protein
MTYRGWRHAKGLPVRGQRTWTNAWTAYRSNLLLREYKIVIAKRLYGSLPLDSLSTTYLAEQTNLLWKLQWENEWKAAKKKRLLSLKSNLQTSSIDLYSMSKGMVENLSRKKKRKQKAKNHYNKNLFTLGFDPGFTKALVKAHLNSILNKKKKKIVKKTILIFGKNKKK